ncbi:MAG: SUMF1/EgtB/PvdO family nonheme iron enzyme [Acidobacteria bacterium]|nr:SUMF1/EgtB/PvdO family nonheme iron enzyme [Acidobacteriota bacterium]
MLSKGTIINSYYELVEELGSGLSATVWRAKVIDNIDRDSFYVLKIFNLSNPKRKQDFFNEWEIMQQFSLSQDTYVHFGFESFTANQNLELGIIVSQWAKYGTLTNLLENIRLGKEQLSFLEKQELMLKIASGLSSIHSKKNLSGQDLVHRDLKPANILLIDKQLPKIADFAISSWVNNQRVTENPIGAIEYMSPEALEGSVSQTIDVWAVGAVFYELLAEKPLYDRSIWTSPTALMREICDLNKKIPLELPNNIPLEIKNIISKTLEKQAPLRYPSAFELYLALEKAIKNPQEKAILATTNSSPSTTSLLTKPILLNDNIFSNTTKTNNNKLLHTADSINQQPNKYTTRYNTNFNKISMLSDVRKLFTDYKNIILLSIILLIPLSIFSYVYFFSFQEIRLGEIAIPASAPKELLIEAYPPGMILIPKGKFLMGKNSPSMDEKEEQEISMKGFYLDLTEVTNQDFLAFLRANPSNILLTRWKNWSFKEMEKELPVTNVTPEEAEAYASWLGKRLPTEEEWEYAARGNNLSGIKYLYPWGDNRNYSLANSQESGKDRPVKVGSYPQGKSPFNILDLAGNVAEWTASCYKNNKSGNFDQLTGENNCSKDYRIFRGGSYHDNVEYIRTTRRFWLAQTPSLNRRKEILHSIGFRCAKDLQSSKEKP